MKERETDKYVRSMLVCLAAGGSKERERGGVGCLPRRRLDCWTAIFRVLVVHSLETCIKTNKKKKDGYLNRLYIVLHESYLDHSRSGHYARQETVLCFAAAFYIPVLPLEITYRG
jgi:hypothetical protein